MNIGIIGAGNIGSALAIHFRRLQHRTLIANSRGPETLAQVAKETGATPVTLLQAADGVDLLILAIPEKGVPALPRNLLDRLPATATIVNTGNYYPLRDGVIAAIEDGTTESVWVSSMLGRPVIKAFNNITADSLLHKGRRRGASERIALPVSGEDVASKQTVIALLDEMGFDAIDAGPLSESWRYEPGTPAYCPDPTLKELPKLLAKANRSKSAGNRDQGVKLMSKAGVDFPPQELVRIARLSAGLDILKPRSWFALLHLGLAILWSLRANR
jgi:8-hydroxy-5-deazaflavin:NADPH oxidoreductase